MLPCIHSTPGRVLKLAEQGALSFAGTSLLILDSEKDAKGQSLLSMKGPAEETVALLQRFAQQHLISAGGGLKVALY